MCRFRFLPHDIKVVPLLEITLKSGQNQNTCLGTNRQWVQRKNIYFVAKKQQVSLGFLSILENQDQINKKSTDGGGWSGRELGTGADQGGGLDHGGERGGVDRGERANVQ